MTMLRALLVTDLVCRCARAFQSRRIQLAVLGQTPHVHPTALTTALGIDEVAAAANSAGQTIGSHEGCPDVLLQAWPGASSWPARRRFVIGEVNDSRAPAVIANDLLGRREPLVYRLALLRFAPDDTATLSIARLRRAEETLGRWRFKMAGWHDRTAAPAPPSLESLQTALATDLDTPFVLTQMRRLESDLAVPSGAKFAAFAQLDHMLGLKLSRLVGKYRS